MAEARAALHGLEGVGSQPTLDRRVYEGPPDPDALLAHLGYEGFRPGQREPIEAALSGRDSLVVMPTGGGKSLCYQLPGLASDQLTVVVSPLIALMADQWRRLSADGHPAVMIASGLPEEVAREAMAQIRGGESRMVYCSPERFASPGFMEAVGRREVDLLAVDEAHCISEWGHDFRPDYLRLPRVLERLGHPTVMACTATATQDVSNEIAQRLGLRDPLMVRAGFDRPNLSFDIVTFEGKGSKARKLAMLLHGLRDEANRPAIVYCGTRRDTEEVARSLRESGLGAVGYHAGMDPDERASAQHRFMTGDAEVITATNAFGMGVDKADVRSVWHWAIPTSVEAYYQEAGRAGRDRLPARAVLLAGRSDLGRLVRFIQMREIEPESVSLYAQRLKARSDNGHLTIEAPRDEGDRVRLAIAERANAFEVEPAPGGRLELRFNDRIDMAGARAACRAARDRSWRAYRAVESFSFGESCRRRRLLDHFGDSTPGAPRGRCCDVCDPDPRLPSPDELEVKVTRRSPKPATTPTDLSPEDESLLEALREWRLKAAGGKPAYTVANNRTLEGIAAARPQDEHALAQIHGVGPAFLKRHADAVLALVAAR
ncbi:MAG TPA: ATP-dependent DNA helicase RecQ [Solirubrobacterales bacterium]|nr:ATP-dependent DNA helicase RecQ [Solirubrobacterales bacterium]